MASATTSGSRQYRPSRDGAPSRSLKDEIRDLTFRMSRANYSAEYIFAAIAGLKAGWSAHRPAPSSPTSRPSNKPPPAPAPVRKYRTPRSGGEPSRQRRLERRRLTREAQAAELAAEAVRRARAAEAEESARKIAEAAEAARTIAVAEEAALKKAAAEAEQARYPWGTLLIAFSRDVSHEFARQILHDEAFKRTIETAIASARLHGNQGGGKTKLSAAARALFGRWHSRPPSGNEVARVARDILAISQEKEYDPMTSLWSCLAGWIMSRR